MENMRMPELKALVREHRLRGYSRLRKGELIELLQDNEPQAQRRPHPNRPPPPPPQRHTVGPHRSPRVPAGPSVPTPWMSPSRAPPKGATWELEREQENEVRQPEGPLASRSAELEAPLTKRQLKRR